jgi:hypothetical protein
MLRRAVQIVGGVLVVALCVSVAARAAQSTKVDVTGTWTFTVETDAAGTSMPTVTFKQEGEKLTGHYSSMLVGEAELTGSIKNQALEFAVHAEVQGVQLVLKFEGTVDGKDSIKGTLSTEFGGGAFTAKRK